MGFKYIQPQGKRECARFGGQTALIRDLMGTALAAKKALKIKENRPSLEENFRLRHAIGMRPRLALRAARRKLVLAFVREK